MREPYHWCYVEGFGAVVSSLNMRKTPRIIGGLYAFKDQAFEAVPEAWRDLILDINPDEENWGLYDRGQLESVYFFRPMRLDKAALALLILEQFAGVHGEKGLDIWKYLSIKPAIFYIDEYDVALFNKHIGPLIDNEDSSDTNELRKKTGQKNLALFKKLALESHHNDGPTETVTYQTAQKFREFLREREIDVGSTTPIRTRGRRHPFEGEAIIRL